MLFTIKTLWFAPKGLFFVLKTKWQKGKHYCKNYCRQKVCHTHFVAPHKAQRLLLWEAVWVCLC